MVERKSSRKLEWVRHYHVTGMHCAACERLLETRLRSLPGITRARAYASRGLVTLHGKGVAPSAEALSRLFHDEGYTLSDDKPSAGSFRLRRAGMAVGLVGLLLAALLLLERVGLGGLVAPAESASLPALFGLGVVAGLSTCAALVGGILLTLCTAPEQAGRWQAPVAFLAGRLISFAAVGAALGAIGQRASLSPEASSLLVLIAVAIMALTGLRNLGWAGAGRLVPSLRLPSPWSTRQASPLGPGGMPSGAAMAGAGALTVLVPCGFTLTAQALAALSGSALSGAGAMLAFALGTSPSLLVLGLTTTGLSLRPRYSRPLRTLTGAALIAFALYSANAQMNVLGLPSLSDLSAVAARPIPATIAAAVPAIPRATVTSSLPTPDLSNVDESLAPLENGVQVLRMDALAYAYTPSYFRVRAGVPVRWEIADRGTSGCTNAVVSRGLFPERLELARGRVTVKEFVPNDPGLYKFSCWMGMVAGAIEVVEVG